MSPHPVSSRSPWRPARARGDLFGPRWPRGLRLALVTLVVAATPAAAQVADSAAAARSHYRQAGSLLRAGDTTAAVTALGLAASAWPAQGAYHAAYARLAAVAGHQAEALRALKRLVTLGYGWDKTDPVAQALAGLPEYSALERRMLAATAPLRRSQVLVQLRDTLLHPEGIAWDGARRRWLVSSVRQRKIVAVDQRGDASDLVRSGQDGLDAALAIGVDSSQGLVWVASAALPQQLGWMPADSGRSAVLAFDLATGKLRRRVHLPVVAGGHSVGDLTVLTDGTVYASDTRSPALYRIAPAGGDTARVVVADNPLVRSPQGLVADGGRLLVADYSHGVLVVDPVTRSVQALPAPPGVTVLGIDGLVRQDQHHLIGVQNGISPPRIVRLTLSPDSKSITEVTQVDRYLPEAGEPTQGVMVEGAFVYLANSPWSNYDDAGRTRSGAEWPAPLLLRLRLR